MPSCLPQQQGNNSPSPGLLCRDPCFLQQVGNGISACFLPFWLISSSDPQGLNEVVKGIFEGGFLLAGSNAPCGLLHWVQFKGHVACLAWRSGTAPATSCMESVQEAGASSLDVSASLPGVSYL